jgi:hypothetical protein
MSWTDSSTVHVLIRIVSSSFACSEHGDIVNTVRTGFGSSTRESTLCAGILRR